MNRPFVLLIALAMALTGPVDVLAGQAQKPKAAQKKATVSCCRRAETHLSSTRRARYARRLWAWAITDEIAHGPDRSASSLITCIRSCALSDGTTRCRMRPWPSRSGSIAATPRAPNSPSRIVIA